MITKFHFMNFKSLIKPILGIFLLISLFWGAIFFTDHRISVSAFDVNSFQKRGYTKDEIALFGDIAFREGNRLRKWETDIKVEIKNINALSPRDIADVDSCIAILAPLVLPLKMTRVSSDGNLLVYMGQDKLPVGNGRGLGYTDMNRILFFTNCSIRKVSIYEVKYLNQKDVLIHEFEHAIGLSHASKPYSFRLTMSGPECPAKFKSIDEMDKYLDIRFPISDQEKKVIKMLYSSDFKSGLNRNAFNKLILQ